jgi:N-acetylneuraminic acid mutarotase
LYFWGGFNYTEPFCYADGWKLERKDQNWSWTALPALPWKLTSSALAVIGERIYAIGGADYDGATGFFTESDRSSKLARLGARLLEFDTAQPERGRRELPACPGTPRFVHAAQAVNGKLFVIGGATGNLVRDGKSYGYCTVVDNWSYDLATAKWSRLRDLPVSSGNFPKSSNLVYANRYILLPGGHQYSYVANPDGTVREKYGAASQQRAASGLHNDVFVYDTQTNLFGTADKLPIDNNLPMSVVRDDKIYLLGGETGGGEVEGEYYGHHPDLLLIGTIRPIE